nr:SPM_beta_lactamase [uncultured bacterium]
MKNTLFIAALILASCAHDHGIQPSLSQNDAKEISSSASAAIPIDENLSATQLKPDVWLVQDKSFYDTNVLLAKMPGRTVVIASSFIDTPKTAKLIAWINQTLKPKEIRAINTHFHFDGTGGNEAYHQEGVQTWSTQQTLSLYKARADSMRSSLADSLNDKQHGKDLRATNNTLADHIFNAADGLEWDFQGEKLIVYYPGPAHSPDNLVVYLPSKRILFGGCMVRALDYDLGNTADADLKNYYKSALSLKRFPAEIVIPGHGQKGGMDLIDHTITLASKASQKP